MGPGCMVHDGSWRIVGVIRIRVTNNATSVAVSPETFGSVEFPDCQDSPFGGRSLNASGRMCRCFVLMKQRNYGSSRNLVADSRIRRESSAWAQQTGPPLSRLAVTSPNFHVGDVTARRTGLDSRVFRGFICQGRWYRPVASTKLSVRISKRMISIFLPLNSEKNHYDFGLPILWLIGVLSGLASSRVVNVNERVRTRSR